MEATLDAKGNMIHPTALIDKDVSIGNNVVIGPYVLIEAGAKIHDGVSIGPFTIIHGGEVGRHVKIYPHVYVGICTLGAGVTIGQGCRIEDDVLIGPETSIWHHSVVLRDAVIGSKCSFGQNVHVAKGVQIGHGVKVQNGISIYEGVAIKDRVFLGPHMVFTNVTTPRADINRKGEYAQTIVGEGATIGANATIVCGHTIGERSFVAAGALVTKDVPARTLVVSKAAAAKPAGPVCDCGEIPRALQKTTEGQTLAYWCDRCQAEVLAIPPS